MIAARQQPPDAPTQGAIPAPNPRSGLSGDSVTDFRSNGQLQTITPTFSGRRVTARAPGRSERREPATWPSGALSEAARAPGTARGTAARSGTDVLRQRGNGVPHRSGWLSGWTESGTTRQIRFESWSSAISTPLPVSSQRSRNAPACGAQYSNAFAGLAPAQVHRQPADLAVSLAA